MRLLILSTTLCAALALGACSTQPPGTTALLTAESADSAALAALIVYEKTPAVNKAVVTKLLADQALVDAALAPAETAAEAGQPITVGAGVAGALAAFEADETANGINPSGVK